MEIKIKPLVWNRITGRRGENGELDWDAVDVCETVLGTYTVRVDLSYPSGKINGYYLEIDGRRFGSKYDIFDTRDDAMKWAFTLYKKTILSVIDQTS